MSFLSILICRLKYKSHSHIYSLIKQNICLVSAMCQELCVLGPGNTVMNESNNKKKIRNCPQESQILLLETENHMTMSNIYTKEKKN